ncbi:MAG: hypothetical protein ACYDA8_08190 [Deferrisomatales bacterium]
MKRWSTVAVIGLTLAALGCAGGPLATHKEDGLTRGTKIKCPHCGVDLTIGQGLDAIEKAR